MGQSARERELPKNKADQCDCHDMTYLTFSTGLSSAYGLWRLQFQFQFQFKLEHKFNYHDDGDDDEGKPSREHANKLSSSQMPLTVRDWSCELRAGPTTGPKRAAQSSKFRVPRPCLQRTRSRSHSRSWSRSRSLCLALAINCDFC